MWTVDGVVDNAQKAGVARKLARRQEAEFQIAGQAFKIKKKGDNYRTFADTFGNVARAAHGGGSYPHALPANLSVFFDPRFAVQEAGVGASARRVVDGIMTVFGEQASQRLNRQPSWITANKQWFRHFKRIGLEDEFARTLANEKATETINWIFYNTAAQTRMLRSMNKVSPFFTAWWEVMQTWAYKIPSQNYAGLGHAQLARKVDRFMKGLVKTGIVEISDPDELGERQWFLNLKKPGETEINAFGAAVSNLGRSYIESPFRVVEHLANLGRMATQPWTLQEGKIGWDFDEYKPVDLSDFGKDSYQLAIGSPINPLDHGIFAVNQMFMGVNPVIQSAYYSASQPTN